MRERFHEMRESNRDIRRGVHIYLRPLNNRIKAFAAYAVGSLIFAFGMVCAVHAKGDYASFSGDPQKKEIAFIAGIGVSTADAIIFGALLLSTIKHCGRLGRRARLADLNPDDLTITEQINNQLEIAAIINKGEVYKSKELSQLVKLSLVSQRGFNQVRGRILTRNMEVPDCVRGNIYSFLAGEDHGSLRVVERNHTIQDIYQIYYESLNRTLRDAVFSRELGGGLDDVTLRSRLFNRVLRSAISDGVLRFATIERAKDNMALLEGEDLTSNQFNRSLLNELDNDLTQRSRLSDYMLRYAISNNALEFNIADQALNSARDSQFSLEEITEYMLDKIPEINNQMTRENAALQIQAFVRDRVIVPTVESNNTGDAIIDIALAGGVNEFDDGEYKGEGTEASFTQRILHGRGSKVYAML